MQAPEEEVHGEVHVGALLSRGEDTGVPGRAQGVWCEQRHKDHHEPEGGGPEGGCGLARVGSPRAAEGPGAGAVWRLPEGL